jgi:hypothetical protein
MRIDMIHNLAELTWSLRGFTPYQWGWGRSMETGVALVSEIPPVPARVPGSVQGALRAAGLLPDWRVGLNARDCEWVEHRHWLFEARLPDGWRQPGATYRLRCLGLDGAGWLLVNGKEVGSFANAFVPHEFDLTAALRGEDNRLQIVFDCPPRWLGQFGYTSRMTEWKPRFNYTWDWQPRLVQIGIWDAIELEVVEARATDDAAGETRKSGDGIQEARCWTAGDTLHVVAERARCATALHGPLRGGGGYRSPELAGWLQVRRVAVVPRRTARSRSLAVRGQRQTDLPPGGELGSDSAKLCGRHGRRLSPAAECVPGDGLYYPARLGWGRAGKRVVLRPL